jgi:hypothetical protein
MLTINSIFPRKSFFHKHPFIKILFFSLLCCFSVAFANEQNDTNGDGRSDVVLVSILQDGLLQWKKQEIQYTIQNVAFKDFEVFAYFGKAGDHLVPANWTNNVIPEIGVVAVNTADGSLIWRIRLQDGSVREFQLGNRNDTIVSGADFNGNGYADAAVVKEQGGKLVWSILLDPLSPAPGGVQELRFGRKGESIFYWNKDGTKDYPAVFRKSHGRGNSARSANFVYSADLASRKVKKLNLGQNSRLRSAPLPVRAAEQYDALVFVNPRKDTTNLEIYNNKGKRSLSTSLPFKGTAIVSRFDTVSAAESIGVYSDVTSQLFIFNPFSRSRESFQLAQGIPVDHININTFSSLPPNTPPSAPGTTPNAPATQPSGSNDPVTNCIQRNPRDGGGGFVWKPVSDTQRFGVAVLPSRLTGAAVTTEVLDQNAVVIKSLRSKGAGNGNRTAWQDDSLTGADYRRIYGSIYIKVTLSDLSCESYLIANPGVRVD